MKDCKLKWKRLDPRAKKPTVATPGEDLGYDLYAIEDVVIPVCLMRLVRTGVAASAMGRFLVESPWGARFEWERMGLLYRDRSSMAKQGIMVSGGVIDAGYKGELVVMLNNVSNENDYVVKAGDKIIQMVPQRVLTGDVEETDDLGESKRGDKGFGSSGR